MTDKKKVLIESLSQVFPQTDEGRRGLEVVASAIDEFVTSQSQELETLRESHTAELEQISVDINEQYGIASRMILETESNALQGYEEAAQMLDEANIRHTAEIEQVREEAERALEAGYEEAAQMIDKLRAEKDALEMDLAEEYDARLEQQRLSTLDLIDSFLVTQGSKVTAKIYEAVLQSPEIAAESNALRRIQGILAGVALDEDTIVGSDDDDDAVNERRKKAAAVADKVVAPGECDECMDELSKLKGEAANMRASLRASEARNVRLNVESTRMSKDLAQIKEKYESLLAEMAGDSSQDEDAPLAESVSGEAGHSDKGQAEDESAFGRGRVMTTGDIVAEASFNATPTTLTDSGRAAHQDDGDVIEDLGISKEYLERASGASKQR